MSHRALSLSLFLLLQHSLGVVVKKDGEIQWGRDVNPKRHCHEEGEGCSHKWQYDCCAGLRCDETRANETDTEHEYPGLGTCQSVNPSLCEEENILSFHNVSFDEKLMTFHDVLPPNEGDPIDLVLVNDGGYEPRNTSWNGLHGKFGCLNFKTNTAANITFRFVNRATGKPVKPHGFYFTIFDLDEEKDGGAKETVTVPSALHWYRDEFTNVVVAGENSMSSGSYGNQFDNPRKTAMDLDPEERDSLVTFEMPEEPTFQVRFSIGASQHDEVVGRNIQFAGASSLTCVAGETDEAGPEDPDPNEVAKDEAPLPEGAEDGPDGTL